MKRYFVLCGLLILKIQLFAVEKEVSSEVENQESEITIITSDQKEFKLDINSANQSNLLKGLLIDLGLLDTDSIPVDILSQDFEIIQTILTDLYNNAFDTVQKKLNSLELNKLVNIAHAVNYLDVPQVMDYVIQAFTNKPFSNDFITNLYRLPESIRIKVWQKTDLFIFYYTQALQKVLNEPLLTLKGHGIKFAQFSFDGNYYILKKEQSIRIIDIARNEDVIVKVPFLTNKFYVSRDSAYIVVQSGALGDTYDYIISLKDKKTVLKLKNEIVQEVSYPYVVSYTKEGFTTYIRDLEHPETFEKPLKIDEDHEQGSLVFDPLKKLFGYSIQAESLVKLYNLASLEEEAKKLRHEYVDDIAFSRDQNYIISVDSTQQKNNIKLWDVSFVDRPLAEFSHNKANQVVTSERGSYSVTLSHDGSIKVWDFLPARKKMIANFYHKHLDRVVYFKDDTLLITQSRPSSSGSVTVKIFDLENLDKEPTELRYSKIPDIAVAEDRYLAINGSFIVNGTEKRRFTVWHIDNMHSPLVDMDNVEPLVPSKFVVSSILVTADGLLILVDIENKKAIFALPTKNNKWPELLLEYPVQSFQFNFSGNYMALLSKLSGRLTVNIVKVIKFNDPRLNDFTEEQMKLLFDYYSADNKEAYSIPSDFSNAYSGLSLLVQEIIKPNK